MTADFSVFNILAVFTLCSVLEKCVYNGKLCMTVSFNYSDIVKLWCWQVSMSKLLNTKTSALQSGMSVARTRFDPYGGIIFRIPKVLFKIVFYHMDWSFIAPLRCVVCSHFELLEVRPLADDVAHRIASCMVCLELINDWFICQDGVNLTTMMLLAKAQLQVKSCVINVFTGSTFPLLL